MELKNQVLGEDAPNTELKKRLAALELTWLSILDELVLNWYVLNGVSKSEDVNYETLDVLEEGRSLEVSAESLASYMRLIEELLAGSPYIFDTNDVNHINAEIKSLRWKIESGELTHNDIISASIAYGHIDKLINPIDMVKLTAKKAANLL